MWNLETSCYSICTCMYYMYPMFFTTFDIWVWFAFNFFIILFWLILYNLWLKVILIHFFFFLIMQIILYLVKIDLFVITCVGCFFRFIVGNVYIYFSHIIKFGIKSRHWTCNMSKYADCGGTSVLTLISSNINEQTVLLKIYILTIMYRI